MLATIGGLIFGIAVTIWAHKRGYAWWAYIFASPIVAAIAINILPNLNDDKVVVEDIENKRRQGNITGLIITGVTLAVLMIINGMK